MTQNEKDLALQAQQEILLDRQAQLAKTDYIAAKIAEGAAKKSEYTSEIAQRQQWRDDINAAQAEIDRLNALTPEEPEANENENENLSQQEQ